MNNLAQDTVKQEIPQFAEWLIQQGKLDPEKLERALRLQDESGKRLETVLVQLGLVAEREISEALAHQLDLPLTQPDEYTEVPVLQNYLSPEFLKQARVVPLAEDDDRVVVAMADPMDEFALRALAFATGKIISVQVGTAAGLRTIDIGIAWVRTARVHIACRRERVPGGIISWNETSGINVPVAVDV